MGKSRGRKSKVEASPPVVVSPAGSVTKRNTRAAGNKLKNISANNSDLTGSPKKDQKLSAVNNPSLFRESLPELKENAQNALENLLNLVATQKEKSLFQDLPVKLNLNITSFKIPTLNNDFVNILLPHAIYPETADVIMIIMHDKDPNHEDYQDDELKADLFKQKLLLENGIKLREVFTLKRFRRDFSTFEAKRALAKRVDMILAEKPIVKHLPDILGREIYRKKVPLLPINFANKKDIGEQVKNCMRRAVLKISTRGKDSAVFFGTDELSTTDLLDNFEKVVTHLRQTFPGGWPNIAKLFLEAPGTAIPLPIYFATGETPITKPVMKAGRRNEVVTEEISTQLKKKVTVYPDGQITVKHEDTDTSDVEIPDDDQIEGVDEAEDVKEEEMDSDDE